MNSIKIHKVNKSFGDIKVLDDIEFEIKDKEIICLVGPSGCGKSTILNLLSGRFRPDSGAILNLEEKKISFVFQKPRLIPWLTLEKNLEFVLDNQMNKDEIISQWIMNVELEGYEKAYSSQLSGGMEQRASLARAFIVPSDLLLMDEPFKGLDEPLKIRMLDLVYKLWKKKPNTIVFVTHDIREALLLGHRIIVFKEKPTQVLEDITIDIAHKERHIGCHKIAKLEEYIYSLMSEKDDYKCCKFIDFKTNILRNSRDRLM